MAIQLRSLLTEAQADYYHATGIFQLESMLNDDAIKLTFTGGTPAEQEFSKGKLFYLSMMRVKYGRYALSGISSPKNTGYNVILHLDGRKLSANYKIFPVDYWGYDREHSEQEDRLVSDKDELKPLSRYVIDVHVYVGKIDHDPTIRRLHHIANKAPERGIKVYFYGEGQEQVFKYEQSNKATTDINKYFPTYPEEPPDELAYNTLRKTWEKDSTSLEEFMHIYHNEPPINKKRYDMVENWLKYYPHDAVSQLEADAHNYKSKHLAIYRDIRDAIRKEKLSTFKDLILLVVKRYRDEWERSRS